MAGRYYSKFIRALYFAGDIILLNIAFLSAYLYKFDDLEILQDPQYIVLGIYFNLAWMVAAYFLNIYNISFFLKNEKTLQSLIRVMAFHIMLVTVLWVGMKAYYYSREHLFVTYLIFAVLIILWRMTMIMVFKFYRRVGYNYRKVVIAGYGEVGQELQDFFKNRPEQGYRFLGYFDDYDKGPQIKGTIQDLKQYVLDNDVDEICCSLPDLRPEQVSNLIRFADNNLIRIKILPDFRGFAYKKIELDFFENVPVLFFRREPLDDPFNRFLKRTFDIVFSSCVIIFLLSWLLPLISLIIKITSPGEIFFKQQRSGRGNRIFTCLKFRTMYKNEDSDKKQATKGDCRVTPIGNFLRKTNLDELPQFFNVFIGNMSVVGPRPHMLKHTEEYSKLIDKYMVRHFVKPGITGLAQVKGYRGETRNTRDMRNRVKVDIFYIENWSFLLDLKIILLTISNMFKGDENAV